jgi:hypothetical protein
MYYYPEAIRVVSSFQLFRPNIVYLFFIVRCVLHTTDHLPLFDSIILPMSCEEYKLQNSYAVSFMPLLLPVLDPHIYLSTC